MIRTASAGSSVEWSRSTSLGEISPFGEQLACTQSSISPQKSRADQDDREVPHLAGLDQRQRLVELVERAEAAGEDDEALGRLHEHRLAGVEVLERHRDVAVGVQALLVRELDVEADREPAALLAAAVRGLHHARAAAGDDGEARLGEEPAGLARVAGTARCPRPRGPSRRSRRPGRSISSTFWKPPGTRTRSPRRRSRDPRASARGRAGRPSEPVLRDVRGHHAEHERAISPP